MEMNIEGGAFASCVRHPSQFFTGFCSSCLLERLSNVDAVERNPNPSAQTLNEIVEISTDSERNHNEVRGRRTLLSLFQLDDNNGVESNESSSCSGRIEEDKGLERSESAGSSSWFPTKGLKWRSASKRAQVEEGCFDCIIGAKNLDRRHSLRHSCEWWEGGDDSKDRLEKPRHSWDGSMVGKALTCSFTCLDEPQDGSSRIPRGRPEEASGSADSRQIISTMTATLPDEKPKSPIGSSPNVSDVSRKKSHRWMRVWDWSITSPFRDFGKKREHVLERSLSNCLPESRSNAEPESGSHSNGHIISQTTQGFKRNVNGSNGEIQRYRPDWPKKRESKFGRSRSVHYPSPRNGDNRLLRFYLTPMRTSRSTNKGRTKTSGFFTRGLLGI